MKSTFIIKLFKRLAIATVLVATSASLTGCMLYYYQQGQLEDSLANNSALPLPRILASSANRENSLKIRLLSFNVWALPLALPGADRRIRLHQIPLAIVEQAPDIITLQEAFDPLFREHIDKRLDAYHTLSDLDCTRPMWPFGDTDCNGGLASFSRWPVLANEFIVHPLLPDPKWDEENGKKGFEINTIDTPISRIIIVNVHLYAGRNEQDERQREFQINHLLATLEARQLLQYPVILLGDLNVNHPELDFLGINQASSLALATLEASGFSRPKIMISEAALTYDVKTNQYANLWFNRFEQRQIFDYVLAYSPEAFDVSFTSYERRFDQTPLLSDHYGLLVDLQINKR